MGEGVHIFVNPFLGYGYTKKRKTSIKHKTIKDGAIYTQLISLKVLQLGDCVFKTPEPVWLIESAGFPKTI